ncbi:jg11906 [Pararge aegeria aegeria]|uniref:Jg11906 protein n=1 Tax=Pararge aegeria aegeria TaxID=348720 RepID=A0A8S4RVW8_9NEOP|nr:jg11906 [Pararge aegeria aegeria]
MVQLEADNSVGPWTSKIPWTKDSMEHGEVNLHAPGFLVRTMSAGRRVTARLLGSPVYRVSSDGHVVKPASFFL